MATVKSNDNSRAKH